MPLTFDDLLASVDVDPQTVRLARHQTSSYPQRGTPFTLWRDNRKLFDLYQSAQSVTAYGSSKFLASFVVPTSGETLFVGLYIIEGVGPMPEGQCDPLSDEDLSSHHFYHLKWDSRLEDYAGRVVIQWGGGYVAWSQPGGGKKLILEIRQSFQEQRFPGYFKFKCKLSSVATLPATWIARLRDAQGVYILVSLKTGDRYVGSATGKDGFHGRWIQHAKVGGDAVAFQELPPSDYQVAILHVSAGFESMNDIVRTEHAWMDKLQSRSMGLNGTPATSVAPEPL